MVPPAACFSGLSRHTVIVQVSVVCDHTLLHSRLLALIVKVPLLLFPTLLHARACQGTRFDLLSGLAACDTHYLTCLFFRAALCTHTHTQHCGIITYHMTQ